MEPILGQINSLIEAISQSKGILAHHWEDNPKTVNISDVVVQRRDIKQLRILDPTLLINELGRLHKLKDCIKKWDESKIIKLCEVDVIPDGAATIHIKKSISARIKEGTK